MTSPNEKLRRYARMYVNKWFTQGLSSTTVVFSKDRPPNMSGSPAVVMRLVASAYKVAEKAGSIVRKVLHSGELGVVEKV